MTQEKLISKSEADLLKAEKWFLETYDKNERTSEKMQMLILYKLHEVERKLEEVNHQTTMHWTN
jgi:hypothetical protein